MPRKIGPTIFELLSLDEFVIGYGGWTNVIGSSVSNHVKVRESYGGLTGDVDLGIGSNDILELDLNGRFNYNVRGVEHLRAGADNRTQVFLQNQSAVTLETDGSLYKLVGGIGDDVITVTGNRGLGTDFAIDQDDNIIQLGAGDDTLILHDKDAIDNGADASDLNAVNRTGLDQYDGGLADDLLVIHKDAATTSSVEYQFLNDADLAGFETITIENMASSGAVDLDLSGQTEDFVINDDIRDNFYRGSQGADDLDLGLGSDTIRWKLITDGAGQGQSTGYDIIRDFSSNDVLDLEFYDSSRDNQTGSGDNNRLMFDEDNVANKPLSEFTELILVENSAVAASATLAADIGAAIDSAFNLDNLGDGQVIFAVNSGAGSNWVGIYTDSGNDDSVSAADIHVLAEVQGAVNENSFWQAGEYAPQPIDATIPSDTGSNDSRNVTTDRTFSVSGLTSGHTVGYETNGSYVEGGEDGFFSGSTSPSLSAGSYTNIRVRERDEFGNLSATAASDRADGDSTDFIIDLTAPSVSPTIKTGVTGSSTQTFSWSVSESHGYDTQFKLAGPGGTTTHAVFDSTGSHSKTISGLSEGSQTWYVKHIDQAGNDSGWKNGGTFTVDTIDPGNPILEDEPTLSDNNRDMHFSLPNDSGTEVDWTVLLNGAEIADENDFLPGNLGNFDFYVASGVLAVGSYTWSVKGVDQAGNTTTVSDTFEVTNPAVQSSSLDDDEVFNGSSVNPYNFTSVDADGGYYENVSSSKLAFDMDPNDKISSITNISWSTSGNGGGWSRSGSGTVDSDFVVFIDTQGSESVSGSWEDELTISFDVLETDGFSYEFTETLRIDYA